MITSRATICLPLTSRAIFAMMLVALALVPSCSADRETPNAGSMDASSGGSMNGGGGVDGGGVDGGAPSGGGAGVDGGAPSGGGAGGSGATDASTGGSGIDAGGPDWTGGGGNPTQEALGINIAADSITVSPGQLVFLHGQPFGGEGDYHLLWEQLNGSRVALDDTTSVNPSFTAPLVSVTETLEFSVGVTDDAGDTASETLNVVVEVPQVIVDAGPDTSVTEGQSVSLHALVTGGDGSYSYSWTQSAGPSVVLADAKDANPSFVAPPASAGQIIELELAVTSGGITVTDTLKVSVVVDPIMVNAGPDQDVGETQQISLHARGSGGAGVLTYLWSQAAGPTAAILGATKKNPSIVTPVVSTQTVLTFTLEATDGVRTESDTIDITVLPSIPTVSAGGDGQVLENQVTQLGGDARGGYPPYSYAWSQTAGTSVSLTQADTLTPTFGSPDVAGNDTLTFQLEVTDAVGHVVTDSVDVVVYDSPTQALTAEAGPTFHVYEGGLAIIAGMALGGTGPYSYGWKQPPSGSEPQLGLTSPNTAPERLIVGAPAVSANSLATLQLDVVDGLSATASDTTTITIRNIAFTATAGSDRSVLVGDQVQLHAVTTEARGSVGYTWSQVSGPTISLLQAQTDSPSFVPTTTGTVVLSLIAKDSINTATDTVSISITAPAVTADAGVDASVSPLDTVFLHGAAGAGVGPYSYIWSQTEGPTVPLADFKTDNPSFVAPRVAQATVLKFQVTITDGAGSVASDTIAITLTPVPLIVSAGTNQTVYPETTVSLHGSASGGTAPLSYKWSVASGTEAARTVIDQDTSLNATVVPHNPTTTLPGLIVLDLTVTDAGGQSVTKKLYLGLRPYVQQPLQALSCGDNSRGISCTNEERAQAQLITCPADRPFPVTVVSQLANHAPGEFKTYSTCWDQGLCDGYTYNETRNNAACTPFDPNKTWDGGSSGNDALNCYYCCTEDGCNVPVQPDTALLYTPDYMVKN